MPPPWLTPGSKLLMCASGKLECARGRCAERPCAVPGASIVLRRCVVATPLPYLRPCRATPPAGHRCPHCRRQEEAGERWRWWRCGPRGVCWWCGCWRRGGCQEGGEEGGVRGGVRTYCVGWALLCVPAAATPTHHPVTLGLACLASRQGCQSGGGRGRTKESRTRPPSARTSHRFPPLGCVGRIGALRLLSRCVLVLVWVAQVGGAGGGLFGGDEDDW